jgi:hypothetical protein
MDTLLVRIKPYNPRIGHVTRTFAYRGILFDEARGWMRVSKGVADYLKTVRQEAYDRTSPLAFDVMTENDAKEQDDRELEDARVRASATETLPLVPGRDDDAGQESTHEGDAGPTSSGPGRGRRRKDL